MKTNFSLLFLSFFIGLHVSFAQTYYVANDNIMLQIKEKNEAKIITSLYYGSETPTAGSPGCFCPKLPAETNSTVAVQLGISPIKHLTMMGSYHQSQSDNLRQSESQNHGKLWQASIGTYYFFEATKENKINLGMLADFHVGYGIGNTENIFSNKSESHIDFQQYFIQAGIYYKSSIIDFGINFKRALVNYHNANVFYDITSKDHDIIKNLADKNPYYINQMSTNFSVGNKLAKVYLNANYLIRDHKSFYLQRPGSITVGIIINLNVLFKEKTIKT